MGTVEYRTLCGNFIDMDQVICTYEGCVLEFPTVSSKAKHVKEMHGGGDGGAKKDDGEKTIKCSKCDKYFKKKSYVRLHEKRVHNKTADINASIIPDDTLNQSTTSLNSTLAVENAAEFSDMASADDTFAEEPETEKRVAVSVKKLSGKNTSTPIHQEKTFKCSHCDKMFGKKSYARLHEKRIHKEKDATVVANHEETQCNETLLVEDKEKLVTENVLLSNLELEENHAKNTEKENVELETNYVTEPQPLLEIDPTEQLLPIPGSSKDRNPVLNIFESSLYTSGHPMSRVCVEKTGKNDFRCKVCGLKFLTKRSQVKHFKGHGTALNLDFLTDFIDHENEISLKNTCLRKSSINLKIPNIENFTLPAAENYLDTEKEDSDAAMLEDHDENVAEKMSLSEIFDDLMDIGDLLI